MPARDGGPHGERRALLGRDERGHGEPLVLLHGVATSRLIWHRVIPALAERRRVIAVDVPGFGESEPAGPGFELDEVAGRLVDGLGLERFDLVGHSLGGAVAVATAAAHQDAVRSLVLVAPAGLAPRATRVAAAIGAVAERAVHARRALGYGLTTRARAPGDVRDDRRRRRAAAPGRRTAAARRLRRRAARLGRRPPRARGRPARGPRGRADAARADLGDGGPRHPVRGPGPAAPAAPGRGRREAAAHGHIPQIERPAAFVAALERILAAVGAH